MNLPQIFMYQEKQVRTVIKNDEPWFVAKDVCEVLGISNHRDAVSRLNERMKDEVGVTDAIGRTQNTIVLNEPAVYKLIFRSNKAEAEAFGDWVATDVLPSIRKHGAYMTPQTLEQALLNPDGIITVLTRLKEEQAEKERERQARLAAEAQIEADRPKVLFADSLSISQDSILVNDLAKLMKQKGIDIGEGRLFKWLRENGYLIKSGSEYNMPTQRSMELKIMEIKVGYRGSSDGTTKITRTPKITGKGQIYFINKFLSMNKAV